MKLSKYSKIYPSAEDKESVVLFSTKRASAVLVPPGLIDDIKNKSLSGEEKETLTELGLVVPAGEEEQQEMLAFIRGLNERNKTFEYILVMNLDCNLACRYCFEGKRKGDHYLSDEVEAKFFDFIRKSNLKNKEEIRIMFYGGEPLLSAGRIARISERMNSLARSKGLRYSFSLVTNGTLLTAGVVERLASVGLRSAKVTLDGPREIHDRFRPFKSGTGSFDIIVRNMREACHLIQLSLGGNYTRDNYREFPRLLDYLAQSGLTPDRLSQVKFDPVVNESSEFAQPDFHDGCDSANEPWISEAALFLREEILKRGYRTQKVRPSSCMMQLADSFVVNYDGTLYKCPGLIGRPGLAAGSLGAGVAEYARTHGLDDWKNEECLACSYLPLCFGGCKYLKLLREGDVKGVDCKKAYFDSTLATMLVQDLRSESTDERER